MPARGSAREKRAFGAQARRMEHLALREDSPAFRAELERCEANAHNVRAWLKATVESVHACTRARGACGDAERAFADELVAFGGSNPAVMSAGVGPALWTISAAFKEVSDLSHAAMLGLEKEFANRIDTRIDEDAKALKELRQRFSRADERHRAALDRARAVKASAAEDKVLGADRELGAARLQLEDARCELADKVVAVESGRQVDLLECMLECVDVQARFFDAARAQMGALCESAPAWLALVESKRAELARLSDASRAQRRKERALSEGPPHARSADQPAPDGVREKEGYLFKRGKAGWRRVWVTVRDGSLRYASQRADRRSAATTSGEVGGQHSVNLLLCTVQLKDATESGRRFCFEVLNPTRSLTLQAESETERRLWVGVMRSAIELAYHSLDTTGGIASNSTKLGAAAESAPLAELRKAGAHNLACADCAGPSPDWAAINWGVLLCIECSGIHRSLGVHVSKVRSLTLDTWDSGLLQLMRNIGNGRANQLLEHRPLGRKPGPTTSRFGKHAWIAAKYAERAFVAQPWAFGALAELLCAAARADDCCGALGCLAQGAPIEAAVRALPAPGDLTPPPLALTAVQHAAARNATACIELLCHWGAQLGVTGPHGASALHCAAEAGHVESAAALLRRGANADAIDTHGRSAERAALAAGHARVAALLRAPLGSSGGAVAGGGAESPPLPPPPPPPPPPPAPRAYDGAPQKIAPDGPSVQTPAGAPAEPSGGKHVRTSSIGTRVIHGLFRRGSAGADVDGALSHSPSAHAGVRRAAPLVLEVEPVDGAADGGISRGADGAWPNRCSGRGSLGLGVPPDAISTPALARARGEHG